MNSPLKKATFVEPQLQTRIALKNMVLTSKKNAGLHSRRLELMSEGMKLTILLGGIVTAILIIGLIQEADAEELVRKTQQQEQTLIFGKYPHPWPAMEYYKSKMVHHHLMVDPEPLPMYRLDPIDRYQCNSWKMITGQVPIASGILMSVAISQANPYHIVVTNYGHSSFVGYLNIPCNEGTLGMYDVHFSLWENPTIEDVDFVETPLLISMKVEVYE